MWISYTRQIHDGLLKPTMSLRWESGQNKTYLHNFPGGIKKRLMILLQMYNSNQKMKIWAVLPASIIVFNSLAGTIDTESITASLSYKNLKRKVCSWYPLKFDVQQHLWVSCIGWAVFLGLLIKQTLFSGPTLFVVGSKYIQCNLKLVPSKLLTSTLNLASFN